MENLLGTGWLPDSLNQDFAFPNPFFNFPSENNLAVSCFNLRAIANGLQYLRAIVNRPYYDTRDTIFCMRSNS